MEMRKVVMCGVLSLLGILSAVTAFAAEATRTKRSQVEVTIKTCPRSPAFSLGITSALFLLMAQIIASVSSGCFCCRKGPAPSRSNWIISLICFIVSWFTFVIGLRLLLAGAVLNNKHNVVSVHAGTNFCLIVPGLFSAGAVFSLVTIALGIVYYLCLSSSKEDVTATTANQGGGIAMGQPQILERVEDPVFVHEDTYMRRQFT